MKNTRLFLGKNKINEAVKRPRFKKLLDTVNKYFIEQGIAKGYDEEYSNLFKWYITGDKKPFASVIATGLTSKFKEELGFEDDDFYVKRGNRTASIDLYRGNDEIYEIYIYLNLKPEGESPNIEVGITEVL